MKYVLTDAAVRKLRGVLAPRSGNTGAGGAATPVSPDDFPPPFTVRWAQSESNGQGAWVIWMPSNGRLFYWTWVPKSFGGITAAQTLPQGWFTIDDCFASSTGLYIIALVKTDDLSRIGTVTISSTVSGHETTGYTAIPLQIASMSRDTTTGKVRVKQLIDSAVTLSMGGGGSAELDDVSTDYNGDGEVQIKDWDTGTPASGTTIAQDIHNADGATAQGELVERTTGGVLNYKKPGTLAQLLGSTVSKSSQKILTGLAWNTTSHKLVISSANITVENGVITNWIDNNDENIDTTPISDIV